MGRPKNPRRVLLAMVADVIKSLNWVRFRWSSQHYTSRMINPTGYAKDLRKREPGEYPEGNSVTWSEAWAQLDITIEKLIEARDYAERQWRTFPGNEGYDLARKAD